MTKKKVKVSVQGTEVPAIATETPPELKLTKNDVIDIIHHNLKTELSNKEETIKNSICQLKTELGKSFIIPKIVKVKNDITKRLDKTTIEFDLEFYPFNCGSGINGKALNNPNSVESINYVKYLTTYSEKEISKCRYANIFDISITISFKILDVPFKGRIYEEINISDEDRKFVTQYFDDLHALSKQLKDIENTINSIGDKSSIKARLNMSIAKGSANGVELAQNISNLTSMLLADITPRLPG